MQNFKRIEWIGILLIGSLMVGCASHRCVDGHNRQAKSGKQYKTKQYRIPINQEVTQQPLSTEGTIPDWLNGTFVRNGPVSVQINNQKQCHWFDGLAMLHAFTFQQGNVSYSNKFLRTDPYYTVFMKGSLNFLGFDTIPDNPALYRIKEFFRSKKCPALQNADVNVAKVANRYIALTETPLPVEFDIQTLQTKGAFKYQDRLPKEFNFDSAHPKVDGRTGEQFNYIVDYGLSSQYIIYRYHPECPRRECVAKIPVGKPSYMHSFALTKNYIILVEFPLVVNPLNIMFMTKPFIQNYYWDPRRGTNFVIVDRCTGKCVKKIRTKQPFFAFHHVNAYEENNNILLDIVTYKDACIIPEISQHGFLSQHFVDEKLPSSELVRYTLCLDDCSIKRNVIFKGSLELPRINEQYIGYDYRYIYGSDQRLLTKADDIRPIYKVDTRTGQIQSWEEAGLLPGEPVFIPRPGSTNEDDGVIVNIVLDMPKQKAFLLILDGQTFKELGRAYAPFAIPIGLHGQFF